MQKASILLWKGEVKKMLVYQKLDVDTAPPAFTFIKNGTPTHVFSWEFCELFSMQRY